MSSSLSAPPLSLYIHIPWCVKKCPYCDFNSHEAGSSIPESEYVAALKKDLDRELERVSSKQLESIFIGGGTPSLFSANAIAEILDYADRKISFSPSIEITLEANPGTVEQKKFSGFHAAGVNRLSIGVQSFNAKQLQKLGRIHDSQQALSAIGQARQAGFENFNLDLMHGLPGQTVTEALEDLKRATDFEPTHLSWYQLTIEPNTAFYKAPPTLPIDDALADIQDAGQQHLAEHGYQQYEISAYSQSEKESQHNLNYWRFGDYLGIGAGAHGKLTLPLENRITRYWKTRKPADYLDQQKSFLAGERDLKKEELPLEFMMNTLRLSEGCAIDLFEERTGLSLEAIQPTWQELINIGLVCDSIDTLKTSTLGQRYLNEVLEKFMR